MPDHRQLRTDAWRLTAVCSCIAWKSGFGVAVLFFEAGNGAGAPWVPAFMAFCAGLFPAGRCGAGVFFVRVNQVLVRLWARAMRDGRKSVRCPVGRLRV